MWLLGSPNVERLKANRDIRRLVQALTYKRDATVRESAAQALVELGHGHDAVEALSRWRDPTAVEPLKVLLKDQNPGVRKAATKALEKFSERPSAQARGRTAVEWLIRLLVAAFMIQIFFPGACLILIIGFTGLSEGCYFAGVDASIRSLLWFGGGLAIILLSGGGSVYALLKRARLRVLLFSVAIGFVTTLVGFFILLTLLYC